ncbi:TetR family transcriptional regulator [Microbacterium sp. ET2]|uniref:TetR family transcriptional regulator n=1 Tax=Microbacterium albipurpureum TaxID=3050384 RepID=UPI00259CDB72|nr:TetR family transcriptional regulator [Microbacterium sp. ET2 (Ac-2212)]WJL94494.1 TetR family transcriptional regulator [Microbacterium sp. ET2 (Ac-2212)]
MTSPTPAPGLWARSRQRAYAEITEVAMGLFLANGFDNTTIDEIAQAAGISRRSFFRYFGTKEDVVLGHFVADGALLRAELEKRPTDEDAWEALQAAVTATLAAPDQAQMLAVSRMMYGTPSLRARSIEKHLRWYDDLVPEVERRLPPPTDARALAARVLVGTAITCIDLAGEAWTRDDGARPLLYYVDAALTAVRPKA